MSYDVKNDALAFLKEVKAAAERSFRSAVAVARSKEGAFHLAENEMMKLEDVVYKEHNFLSSYKRKRNSELSKRRAALREKKRELKAARAELRKARAAYRCAERASMAEDHFLSKVRRAYTQVERTWISGCVVSSKPRFNKLNLIPD